MDDLFDVFTAKPAARAAVPAEAKEEAAAGGEKRKRAAEEAEEGAEAEASDGEEEEEEGEEGAEGGGKGGKKAKGSGGKGGGDDLCPASGPGACQVHDITQPGQTEGRKACRHHVAVPPGMNLDDVRRPAPAKKPAKEYKFVLDPFQAAAVGCLEKGQSVLVAAHTSAGKTAVAEYAIAMALRDNQRVVYTSPIKALSNQKFRELTDEFQDVGLMTGDVTINPDATLLVMTTEILRSMLYRGSELVREVVWIIYDEVHYMRDRERGVVWEESIVMVPSSVRFVFLSATIPNAPDFACWVSRVHRQPCNVIYTEYRPTPLQHYMFPAGGDGLHLVVDEDGNFREENFHKCLAKLDSAGANTEMAARKKSAGGGGPGAGKKKGGDGGGSDIYKIVRLIVEKNFDPVIVFCFSKKDCEGLAVQLSKLEFNSEDEKANVRMIFQSATDSLSPDDRQLPSVVHFLPLLEKGIGIHHSGLLPILKETVEILFQEGLVKVLCATETFSMGLNMPAKTCVFTGVRKWDGEAFRWVSSGEYIQMSGRAGRRGLDDKGIVILMVDEKMEPDVAKNMVKGESDPLNSSFHLGYNMLLNLLRFEGGDPEYLIRRSFFQFQQDKQRPVFKEKIVELEAERAELIIEDEPLIAEYHQLVSQHAQLQESLRQELVRRPKVIVPFLQPGRLLRCLDPTGNDWGWGVLTTFRKAGDKFVKGKKGDDDGGERGGAYLLDVCLPCAAAKSIDTASGQRIEVGEKGVSKFVPPREGERTEMQVIEMPIDLLQEISSIRVHVPQDLRSSDARRQVAKTVQVVHERFEKGIPVLDPADDLRITDESYHKIARKVESLEARVHAHKLHKDVEKRDRLYPMYKRKIAIVQEIAVLTKSAKAAGGLTFRAQLKGMKRVLRRLGHVTADDAVQLKGRAACEISSGDELVLTEMIFDGAFNDLPADVCAAVLSCFVFDEKAADDAAPRLPEELMRPLEVLKDKARRVATVQAESKLEVDVTEFVAKFKTGLMALTLRWCRGAKFSELVAAKDGTKEKGKTDLYEGSIIRCIRRLEELVSELSSVCKVVGNVQLSDKFAAASTLMKRDIIFAASLYLEA